MRFTEYVASWTRLSLVVALVSSPVAAGGSTPVLFARGTHYEVGYEMGQGVRHLITRSIGVNQRLDALVAFNRTDKGRHLYTNLLEASQRYYPQYVEELRGVAAGAEIDFGTNFLLMIEPEIDLLLKAAGSRDDGSPPSGGCSDFMVRNDQSALHVHSEDTPPETRYLGSIWVAEIIDKHKRVTESFIAYTYPGFIPCSAWGLNSHGLMKSGNILTPKISAPDGAVPRRIMSRALMGASSIDDFLAKLREAPAIGSGFNYQLSERVCSEPRPDCVRMVGVEIVNDGDRANTVHVHETTSFDFHFNEYQYLRAHVPHHHDHSSRWRNRRVAEYQQELGAPMTTMDQVRFIMSDQQNRKFPFFRDGASPDYLATGSIAIADHYHLKLHIYKDMPTHAQPEVTFDLRPWHGRALNLEERILQPELEVEVGMKVSGKDEL